MAEVNDLSALLAGLRPVPRPGLSYGFVAAWITLQVRSPLYAVGLTAAVSAALAASGVSGNVIAGYHHDHLHVPFDRAQATLPRCWTATTPRGGPSQPA